MKEEEGFYSSFMDEYQKEVLKMRKNFILILVLVLMMTVFASPVFANTGCDCDCNKTPGYWKNHTEAWVILNPEDHFDGGLSYIQALGMSNAKGDAWVTLARAYIAALLNGWSPSESSYHAGVVQNIFDNYNPGELTPANAKGNPTTGEYREVALMYAEFFDGINNNNF